MFGESGKSTGLPEDLLAYTPQLFTEAESAAYLQNFIATIPWEQRTVMMYGKPMITPRLTAWFGDTGKNYAYTGTRFQPHPWTKELLAIKARIEPLSGVTFNSVLLNYYRDGNDSVAWHSDKDTLPGMKTEIASVSLGQVRHFDFRSKADHSLRHAIALEHGSLLLMKGDLQRYWEHRIAKSPLPMGGRINLTFRKIGP